jgi:hypothetical protein
MVFRITTHTAATQPRSHPDSCFVLSGLRYFGCGNALDEAKLKALTPGSNCTESTGAVHFAGTNDRGVVLECTAVVPAGARFVNPADDPRNKRWRNRL